MIEIVTHNNIDYPALQAKGFAAKFAFPFAKEVCFGDGCDVGCNRREWAFVDKNGAPALMVDPAIKGCKFEAMKLPPGKFDYIFSSHAIEHMPNWVDVLNYWQTKIKCGGTLFLYLPSDQQTYWKSWHNRKHIHMFNPQMIRDYLTDMKWSKIFVSGIDLNHSFIAIAEKP